MCPTPARYVTFVSHSLQWEWTKPCRTEEDSIISAVNMICARIMDERGIQRPSPNYSFLLRKNHPEIVLEAYQYIGETRPVEMPENMTPKQFQRWFCTLQIDSESNNTKEWQDEVA